MTTTELRDKLLRVLWAVDSAQTPTHVHKDVAIAVNRAFQEIWSAPASDYLRRQSGSFSTVGGTAAYELASNLIEMLGPVTGLSGPLLPIRSKADYSAFAARFLQADQALATGDPVAYYLQRTYSGDSDVDPVKVEMLLSPTPITAHTVSFEAAFAPPTFTDCDLDSDSTVLPMPHAWHESILLPIAQFHILDSHWFSRNELSDATQPIMAGYAAARRQLGLADPQIDTVKKRKPQNDSQNNQ